MHINADLCIKYLAIEWNNILNCRDAVSGGNCAKINVDVCVAWFFASMQRIDARTSFVFVVLAGTTQSDLLFQIETVTVNQ